MMRRHAAQKQVSGGSAAREGRGRKEEGLISEILLEIAPPSKGEIPLVSTPVMIRMRRRGELRQEERERWPHKGWLKGRMEESGDYSIRLICYSLPPAAHE